MQAHYDIFVNLGFPYFQIGVLEHLLKEQNCLKVVISKKKSSLNLSLNSQVLIKKLVISKKSLQFKSYKSNYKKNRKITKNLKRLFLQKGKI